MASEQGLTIEETKRKIIVDTVQSMPICQVDTVTTRNTIPIPTIRNGIDKMIENAHVVEAQAMKQTGLLNDAKNIKEFFV